MSIEMHLDSSPYVCQIMDRLNPFLPRCLSHPHLMHNGLSLLDLCHF